ncbi:MAG: TM2 domain-containing protein [Clostridia bacterium]
MLRIRVCPNCATIIRNGEKKCSGCGKTIEELIAIKSRKIVTAPLNEHKNNSADNVIDNQTDNAINNKCDKDIKQGFDDTINTKNAGNISEEGNKVNKRHKHKKKTQHVAYSAKEIMESEQINAKFDEDGKLFIDTSDVTYLEGASKNNDGNKEDASYSAKKARGEYELPKIKWWEIYKHADRLLARRKISKEVNKASHKKPNDISKTKTILLCIFLGYLGAHNFYVKNIRKGWVMFSFFVLSFGLTILISSISALEYYFMSIVGCLGFLMIFMWVSDLISLIFNKFRYRTSKMDFIRTLNIETRAKLSKKYIKIENVK